MITLDLQSRVPIYEQLKEQIVKLSMLGILLPDEKLPSVRILARDIGVNPNTVQKAYQDLERDGIIYTVSGKGSFVAASEGTKAQIRAKAMAEIKQTVQKARLSGCTPEEILTTVQAALKEESSND